MTNERTKAGNYLLMKGTIDWMQIDLDALFLNNYWFCGYYLFLWSCLFFYKQVNPCTLFIKPCIVILYLVWLAVKAIKYVLNTNFYKNTMIIMCNYALRKIYPINYLHSKMHVCFYL